MRCIVRVLINTAVPNPNEYTTCSIHTASVINCGAYFGTHRLHCVIVCILVWPIHSMRALHVCALGSHSTDMCMCAIDLFLLSSTMLQALRST